MDKPRKTAIDSSDLAAELLARLERGETIEFTDEDDLLIAAVRLDEAGHSANGSYWRTARMVSSIVPPRKQYVDPCRPESLWIPWRQYCLAAIAAKAPAPAEPPQFKGDSSMSKPEAKKGKPAAEAAENATPWEAAGISRRTYFRRKAAGEPIEARQKPVPAPRVPCSVKPASKPAAVSAPAVPASAKAQAECHSAPENAGTSSKDAKKSKDDKPWLIKPGQVLNPKGRPPGSRNKLTDAFVQAMCEDFRLNGAGIVEKVRNEKPDVYLRVIAGMIPKQIETGELGAFSDMSEDELDTCIADMEAKLAQLERGAGGLH